MPRLFQVDRRDIWKSVTHYTQWRQTDRQTDGQPDGQTGGQTDRQTDIQTEVSVDQHTSMSLLIISARRSTNSLCIHTDFIVLYHIYRSTTKNN